VAAKSKVVVVGWLLIGLLATCVFAVALIATFEGGGGFGVDSRVTGRLGTFVPIVYVPLLLAVVGVGAYWVWRQLRRRPHEEEPSNSTLHPGARQASSQNQTPSARAGERGR
jgi:uncharacterized membrane protein